MLVYIIANVRNRNRDGHSNVSTEVYQGFGLMVAHRGVAERVSDTLAHCGWKPPHFGAWWDGRSPVPAKQHGKDYETWRRHGQQGAASTFFH